MRVRVRSVENRHPALLIMALLLTLVGAGLAALQAWVWAAAMWAIALVLVRLWRGWPWAAAWIFRREIGRISATGEVSRRLLLQRFIKIAPESHKDDLGRR